ncbi:subclass B3 metallo-beta-lactamase [Erythrobacter sp. MTPC3]|uniref:subclass B3 metallo-beta-lactamase n=1 Tax=Erythrobacter sp. MTPC3 TaxID=3056564 RepID=UPI0036F3A299
MSVKFSALLAAAVLAGCSAAFANDPREAPLADDQKAFIDTCKAWDEWDKPAPPFKVHGDTYYVGTCGISAILIRGDAGHVLIDTGTETGADAVIANIRTLGVDPQDIELLLYSHEHFDHVGGMAKTAELTGGKLIASKPAAAVFFTGQDHPEDPQYGMHDPMHPVVPERHIESGETETLGNITVTAIATPGHTPGALSWRWQSCEEDDCKTIVYADSLSPVSSDSYRFSDHPAYLANYRKGLSRLAAIDCDVLMTPHPSASRMIARMRAGKLVGGMDCSEYATQIMERLDRRLTDESAEPAE